MAKRYVSYEEREEFFELLCSGLSLDAAATGSGVSGTAGRGWWRASGLVSPTIQMGRHGGLTGTAPARLPGSGEQSSEQSGEQRQRRPLSSEDRAVIAAGLRRELSYAQIGALVGRNKAVICREVAGRVRWSV